MAVARQHGLMGWEERWRRDKERRKRVIEEGGEKIEEENRRLRWIKAYNDNRMGVKQSVWQECTRNYRVPEDTGAPTVATECQAGARTYRSDTYIREMFQNLEGFKENHVLTDLSINFQGGQTLFAHSVVVAAISSTVREKLQEQKEQLGCQVQDEGIVVHLSPDVTKDGVTAVLEFAYTGAMSKFNRHTKDEIGVAAKALGAPRLLEVCRAEGASFKEQDRTENGGRDEEKDEDTVSYTELEISLQALRELWEAGVGCDIVLSVAGKDLMAHRVVMAASSDYFRGMFTSGMRESQQRQVSVPYIDVEELEPFLQCSYSGTLELTWDCVFDLVCSAIQFQIQPALSLCLDFLEREIDPDSCLDVASFAEAYGMTSLLELADDFVLRHFHEVSLTPKFQDLTVEKLLAYLCHDGLCAPSELTVYRAVVTWLEADLAERLSVAPKLMTGVRFPLMTFREFCEVRAVNLSMECSSITEEEVQLYGAAFKDFGFGMSSSEECCRVRHPKDALIVTGGDHLDPDTGVRIPSQQLSFIHAMRSRTGLVKDIEWRTLKEMPEQHRFRHGAAVLAGKLYTIGGCHFYAKEDTMKSGFCYDPNQDLWQKIADMHEPRSNFTLVAQEDKLYAIGGDKEINMNLDSVEAYNPDSNSWSFSCPLDQALSGHAAAVWKGEIFISGGLNCEYKCLVSMFLYHPKEGTVYLSDMIHDRALHCMESLGGRFYVAGGVQNFYKFYSDQMSCEVYNPTTDSWCTFAPLPVPHVGAASAILEEKLYILGGYCQEDYGESRLVHRYELTTDRWLSVGKMTGPTTDTRACVLRLPHHFRQRL